MVFSSTTFLFLFLPIVLIAYYNPIFKSLPFKNAVLIVSSIFFYAWGEPVYVLLMLGSILVNWALGLAVDKNRGNKKGRAALTVSVIVNIGMLFVFKYLTFTLENINLLFHTSLDTLNITLPIGISFFTFQAMSYVIDVYRGNGNVQKNPCNVALYISFFPQLIAGPIVRYQTIADQIKERHENFDQFTDGVYRFMIGFVKKVLIANNAAIVADGIFDSEVSLSHQRGSVHSLIPCKFFLTSRATARWRSDSERCSALNFLKISIIRMYQNPFPSFGADGISRSEHGSGIMFIFRSEAAE